MQERLENFRKLLRTAICDRTQAQFANDSGISPEHLNRLLNSGSVGRPSRQTLHKIAAAASNGVTYRMLSDALDRDDPGAAKHLEDEARMESAKKGFAAGDGSDFPERAHATMRELIRLIETQKLPAVRPNVADCVCGLMHDLNMLPGALKVSFEIGREFEYVTGENGYAGKWLSVRLTMADAKTTASSEMLVFFSDVACPDGHTACLVQKISTQVSDFMDVMGMPGAAMAKYDNLNDDNEAFEKALTDEYFIGFRETTRFRESDLEREDPDRPAMSPEQRLLRALFGHDRQYAETTEGFGFWLDGVPPKFTEFARNHKDVILRPYLGQPESHAALDDAIERAYAADDPEILVNAMTDMRYADPAFESDAGWQSAIALVMADETGFPYRYRAHTPESENGKHFVDLSTKDCVILANRDVLDMDIHREALIMATGKLASQLGLDRFGDLFFTKVMTSFDNPRTYRIKSQDEIREEQASVPEPREPKYDTVLGPDTAPEESGVYAVELKDGRRTRCVYLKQYGTWLARHKDWSRHIRAYDGRMLLPPVPDAAQEGDDE